MIPARASDQLPDEEAKGGELKPLGRRASDLWHLMHDQEKTELFSGGSAGPGKTFNLCLFEVEQSIKYPGTNGALYRATFDDLRKSTLITFFEVCQKCKLRPGIDYVYKESKNSVFWAGGSVTFFDYLTYDPGDPNYSRLGGRLLTRAGLDEVDQIEERAVDVLATRLRYKLTEYCHACSATQMAARSQPVDCDDDGNPTLWECYACKTWTKGLLPKMVMTGNPGDYWTKTRFVCDADGNPVKLKPHQGVVLMLLDDNPDKAHVATYRKQLEAMSDEYDKARLLRGDWMVSRKTGREFLWAYESGKHTVRLPYRPDLPLHITYDFNTAPYMTLLVAQIWQEEHEGYVRDRVHFLQEICPKHPLATTEAVTTMFLRELTEGRYKDHAAGLFIYGDRSGKNKTPLVVNGILHNFDMVERVLAKYRHNHWDRVLRRNPPHTIVRDFCNAYLSGGIPKLWVTFDPRMTNTTQDFVHVKEAADGSILKVMVKDRTTGVSYEKYGHCLQAHYYLVCGAFPDLFKTFVRK